MCGRLFLGEAVWRVSLAVSVGVRGGLYWSGFDGWSRIWCRITLWTRAFSRGGLEVGIFVVVVVGDFFWNPPLLFESIFVIANSCLSFGC